MKTQIFAVAALAATTKAQYYGGEIRTHQPFTYGKFKTRMQGSNAKGTCASLFTFWNGQPDLPWSEKEWEEIDIELVPSKKDPFSTNIIYAHRQMDHTYSYGFYPEDNWHDYEIHWTPDYIAWYIDGVETRRTTSASASVRDMDKGSLLYMNFWTPTWNDWGGGRDDSQFPVYTKYDYIEAYDYDVNTKQFTLRFRDDFHNLNHNIWRVSNNWGFPDNSTRFMETMTYVQDGNLVLKLDKTLNSRRPDNNFDPNIHDRDSHDKMDNNDNDHNDHHDDKDDNDHHDNDNNDGECTEEVNLDQAGIRYGDRCGEKHNRQDCGSCMDRCFKSWSAMDPNQWASQNAQCRCLPSQGSAESYDYGKLARDQTAGLCGDSCDSKCRWSWPKDDPLKWKSDHLMARCMPSGVSPYNPSDDKQDNDSNDGGNDDIVDKYRNWKPDPLINYSNDCMNLNDQACGEDCTQCKWSWPLGDPDTWASNDAMCRCEEKKTFIWGDKCSSNSAGKCGAKCNDCRKATFLDGSGPDDCRCTHGEW